MSNNILLEGRGGELYRNFMKNLLNQCRYSECFHKDHNCSPKIIKAHSLQKNRILNKLSEKGEVLTFSFDISKPIDNLINAVESIDFKMNRSGMKVASTFRGFCQYHDNLLFKPIEEHDYEMGNQEQEFLFAYRAFAKAYSDLRSGISMNKKLVEMIDDRTIEKLYQTIYLGNISDELFEEVKNYIKDQLSGDLLVRDIMDAMKVSFNKNLDYKRFYKTSTHTIVFPKEHYFALSSMIYLGRDINGQIINDFSKSGLNYKPLFITIFPQNKKTYIILSWFKKDAFKFQFIKNDLMNRSDEYIQILLTNIIANKIDNFYYSPMFWEILCEDNKKAFLKQFTASNISSMNDLDNVNMSINIFQI